VTGPTPWRLEFGHLWVRTECSEATLDALAGDMVEMSAFADDVNAAVVDATGLQVCMLPNGWGVCPEGADPREVCDQIDRALPVLAEA